MKSYKRLMRLALLALVLSSVQAHARPYYTGNVVGKCVQLGGFTYNVVATVTAPLWA